MVMDNLFRLVRVIIMITHEPRKTNENSAIALFKNERIIISFLHGKKHVMLFFSDSFGL